MKKAECHLKLGEERKTAMIYEKIFAIDSSKTILLKKAAKLYNKLGLPQKSISLFKQLLAKSQKEKNIDYGILNMIIEIYLQS